MMINLKAVAKAIEATFKALKANTAYFYSLFALFWVGMVILIRFMGGVDAQHPPAAAEAGEDREGGEAGAQCVNIDGVEICE